MFNNICISLALVLFLIKSSYGDELTAEQIIGNLYMQKTIGKIQDMTIDIDIWGPGGNPEVKDEIAQIMTARVFFSFPCKIRIEKNVSEPTKSGLYIVVIRDGRLEWQFLPGSLPVKKEDTHYHSNFLPFNIDYQPPDQYRIYTLMGIEQIDDRDVYVIGIVNEKDPSSKLTTLWIDMERFVPVKEETTVKQSEDKEIKNKILYKNFSQLSDGRWMPFSVEKYENDKIKLIMNYKDISINQDLPENIFSPDENIPSEK
jgi:outer membrane lipoprotein-sorting protein